MGSHISPGLAAEIRYALRLIQERGTDPDAVGIVRTIVSRRLAEIEAETAEMRDSSPPSLTALQLALHHVADELEMLHRQPPCETIAGCR